METRNYSISLVTVPKELQYVIIFAASVTYFAIRSETFRYYLKYVFYVIYMNIMAISMSPVFMFWPKNVRNLV